MIMEIFVKQRRGFHKKRRIFLTILLLLCIMTAAYAPEVSNDVLDEKFQALQTAFTANDEERVFKLLYLKTRWRQSFMTFFGSSGLLIGRTG